MQYEIFDTFQQNVHPTTYNRESTAIAIAFARLGEYVADHVDPELEIGEEDTYRFIVRRDEEHVHHVYVSRMRDQTLMIVRPVTEPTYVDLCK